MRLLIDGYNLLHATGILGRAIGPGSLERARDRLINQIAGRLTPLELASTTIVFDARSAPDGASSEFVMQGIQIRFSVDYVSADEMLVELVRAHSAPETILLVSSDHQVQLAARRRGAKVIDSGDWWERTIIAPVSSSSQSSLGSNASVDSIRANTQAPSTPALSTPVPSSLVPSSPAPPARPDTNRPKANASEPAKPRSYQSLPPRTLSAKPASEGSKQKSTAGKAPAAGKHDSAKTPLFPMPKQVAAEPPESPATTPRGSSQPPAQIAPTPIAKPAASPEPPPSRPTENESRVSSSEVKFWVDQFQEPKTETNRPRRAQAEKRSQPEKKLSRPTNSQGQDQLTSEPGFASSPDVATNNSGSTTQTNASSQPKAPGRSPHKDSIETGSAFDFPDSYLQSIQDEIDREQP